MVVPLNEDMVLWLFILVAALVCAGCLLPAHWLPPIKNDKLAHFFAFGGLSLLARLAATSPLVLLGWLLALALAGLLIEVVQQWVPGRHFCWKDVLADVAGIGAGAGICQLFEYVRPRFFLW